MLNAKSTCCVVLLAHFSHDSTSSLRKINQITRSLNNAGKFSYVTIFIIFTYSNAINSE
jgi:hypothetical protein